VSDSSKKSKGKKAGSTSNSRSSRSKQDDGGRLEKAVQDLLSIAKDEFSDRASSLVEDTTAKLKRELTARRERDEQADREAEDAARYSNDNVDANPGTEYDDKPSRRSRRSARKARRSFKRRAKRPRFGNLTRSRRNRIAGVCGGIAKYRGVDPWVVRCIAVTGMVFIPQVTFPAYIIAWIVLSKEPRFENTVVYEEQQGSRFSVRRKRPSEKTIERSPESVQKPRVEKSPRYKLRNVQSELNQVELRLRRMESHVTSGHYELQKELNRIDN